LRDVLPVLFEFFGVPDPDRPAPRMEPEAKQRLVFGVLRRIVQGADPLVGSGKLVTLIEVLHWLDPASEAFLAEWVDALAGGAGLLVLNFRPEYRAEWMQKSYYRQLPLAPLGREAIQELLDDLLGRDPSLVGLAAAIHARTGGNPFFTEEVVQSLEGAVSAFLVTGGAVDASLEPALAAERAAEASGDPRLRAMARYAPLYPWLLTGPVDRARERADELVAYAREHGDLPAPFGGEDVLPLVMGLQAMLEAQSGSIARAGEILAGAQRVARERGLLESEGWTTTFAGWMEWIEGDAERALPACRRGLEIAERIGSAFSVAHALGALAQVLAHAGSSEALEVAERSVALSRERGTSLDGEGQHLAALSEACVVAGELGRPLRAAEEAVEVGRRRGIRRYEIDAWLALARALRARGDGASLARAREALAEVDALADATRAPNWRYVAEHERAELAAAAGDAAARERHLRAALAGFEAIEAYYRVRWIRELLGGTNA
jgi:hypothetical protein